MRNQKLIEHSGNISGKSPLRRRSKTREGRSPECLLRFWVCRNVWRCRLWTDILPKYSRNFAFRDYLIKNLISVCETQKFIKYSGNISGKSPLCCGSKTREGRRDPFPSDFCGSGLVGTPGAAGFERTCCQNIPTILCFANAYWLYTPSLRIGCQLFYTILENNLVMKSGNCQKRKNMIEYRRGTIVLQGGSLPKLHARFTGVHKRGGGVNDSFWNHFDFHRYIGFADCLW